MDERTEKKGRLPAWEKTAAISRSKTRFLVASDLIRRIEAASDRASVSESGPQSVARQLVQGFLVSSLVEGVAVGAGALVGGAAALGLGDDAGVEAGGGSSGLQPTTTIIANTALASRDKALMPILAITDALLDVKHLTSRVVTLEFPLETDCSTARRKRAVAVQPILVRFPGRIIEDSDPQLQRTTPFFDPSCTVKFDSHSLAGDIVSVSLRLVQSSERIVCAALREDFSEPADRLSECRESP
jgi:hypothetical protein